MDREEWIKIEIVKKSEDRNRESKRRNGKEVVKKRVKNGKEEWKRVRMEKS